MLMTLKWVGFLASTGYLCLVCDMYCPWVVAGLQVV